VLSTNYSTLFLPLISILFCESIPLLFKSIFSVIRSHEISYFDFAIGAQLFSCVVILSISVGFFSSILCSVFGVEVSNLANGNLFVIALIIRVILLSSVLKPSLGFSLGTVIDEGIFYYQPKSGKFFSFTLTLYWKMVK